MPITHHRLYNPSGLIKAHTYFGPANVFQYDLKLCQFERNEKTCLYKRLTRSFPKIEMISNPCPDLIIPLHLTVHLKLHGTHPRIQDMPKP